MIGAMPPLSVIVPFVGSASELAAVVARFAATLRAEDELLVAYNAASELDIPLPDGVVLVWDGPRGSPGAARNAAAARAGGEWLVFSDIDCAPATGWLEGFFAAAPGSRVGLLAGAVRDARRATAWRRGWRARPGRWTSARRFATRTCPTA